MHLFATAFFGLIALFWLTYGLKVAYGAVRLPWLKKCAPAADAECPSISLIFAARDEQQKLPGALATLIAIDYPKLEIIAVDDRSTDATPRILDDFAATHDRLKAVHVRELPAAWLGKPHALQEAYGYVPEPAIPMVADALNLSRAEVHGVFTFYHDFRHEPAGRHVLKLCRAEACQAAGGEALAARAEARLGVKMGEETRDHRVALALWKSAQRRAFDRACIRGPQAADQF